MLASSLALQAAIEDSRRTEVITSSKTSSKTSQGLVHFDVETQALGSKVWNQNCGPVQETHAIWEPDVSKLLCKKYCPHLKIFDEISCETAGCEWGVDALGGEVVELLEVCVHHNLFLIGVLEWLDAGEGAVLASDDVGAATKTVEHMRWNVSNMLWQLRLCI